MKTRRHHNNAGRRQVRMGRTQGQVERMAERLRLRFRVGAIIRDFSEGNVEKYQPGGDSYIDEISPGVREETAEWLTAQGIAAASAGETGTGSTEGKSLVANGHAPNLMEIESHD